MREQEFRAWLKNWPTPSGGSMDKYLVNFYTDAINNIEKAENKNIDEEFQTDEMADISKLYSYSVQDKKANRPNPTNLEITKPSPYGTLADYKTALNHYRRFCLGVNDSPIQEAPDNNDSDSNTDAGTTFGLERDMQDAIRETITQLEPGLEIIDNGVERKVASGFIDILAKDSKENFVVIELKAGKASDSVIAQTLGYMVDIADAEGLEINQVRGIIVAKSFNKRIETAARAVPSLTLKAYTYSFDFN